MALLKWLILLSHEERTMFNRLQANEWGYLAKYGKSLLGFAVNTKIYSIIRQLTHPIPMWARKRSCLCRLIYRDWIPTRTRECGPRTRSSHAMCSAAISAIPSRKPSAARARRHSQRLAAANGLMPRSSTSLWSAAALSVPRLPSTFGFATRPNSTASSCSRPGHSCCRSTTRICRWSVSVWPTPRRSRNTTAWTKSSASTGVRRSGAWPGIHR